MSRASTIRSGMGSLVGLSSGATSIGVSLTHREHAHGVMFVTGHGRGGSHDAKAALDWPVIAAAASQGITLVIYMGIATVDVLQAGLLSVLPGETPVAIVQNASLPQQRHATCRLDALATTIAREALGSPAVIIVGDVVKAVQQLAERRSARYA